MARGSVTMQIQMRAKIRLGREGQKIGDADTKKSPAGAGQELEGGLRELPSARGLSPHHSRVAGSITSVRLPLLALQRLREHVEAVCQVREVGADAFTSGRFG
jgi:hypothetical protein